MIKSISLGLIFGALALCILAMTRPVRYVSTAAGKDWVRVAPITGAEISSPAPYRLIDGTDPTRAKLEKIIPAIDWENTRLAEALQVIAAQCDINVVPHWRILESAGINGDVLVTLHVKNLPARKVLSMILEDLKPASVVFSCSENVVTITTAEELNRARFIRVYDVRDLMETQPVPAAVAGAISPPTVAGGGVFGSTPDRVSFDSDSPGAVLTKILASTLDTESTFTKGTIIACIECRRGRLIISASASVHQRVEYLLAALRGSGFPSNQPITSTTRPGQ